MEAPPEKKARVYYGSLEEQERARLESGDVTGSTLSVAVQEGIQAGNINITPVAGGEVRTVADSRQLQLLEEFEKRKRAKAIVVPTDDSEVKVCLRAQGEPICK
jgi:U4/U6 small nuclear ribonucleoprotein PRP4